MLTVKSDIIRNYMVERKVSKQVCTYGWAELLSFRIQVSVVHGS